MHDALLTMVKKRKLRWYGHILRSSGMAKTILQGTVKGARRRGRQKKRWEDTSRNGWEWDLKIPWWQRKTGKDGKVLLQRYLWCPTTYNVTGLRWDEIAQIKVSNSPITKKILPQRPPPFFNFCITERLFKLGRAFRLFFFYCLWLLLVWRKILRV